MSRKVFIVLLVLGLMSVIVAPLALTADQGEFTMKWYVNWLGYVPQPDSLINKWLGEKTGIYFKSCQVTNGNPGPNDQALLLDIASNSLPDLIVHQGDWSKLIDDKLVIPLDKYFNDPKNYPNLSKMDKKLIDLWKFKDGHIYKIPIAGAYSTKYINSSDAFWGQTGWLVREDVLQKAGMKESDLATLAGVEKFLKKAVTLKDEQGRNYLGFAWDQVSSWQYCLDGTFGVSPFKPDDKGLNSDYAQPGYLKMVQWLSKLYSEGLVDQDAVSQSWDDFKGKLRDGRYAMLVGHSGTIPVEAETSVLQKKFGDDFNSHVVLGWAAIPTPKVPGIRTKPYVFLSVLGFGGKAITKTCKNPDKLMKLLDYLYSPEARVVTYYGVPGAGLKENPDGTYGLDQAFQNDFWNNVPKSIGNIGLWFWHYEGGIQMIPAGATVNGKLFVPVPASSENGAVRRKSAYNTILRIKEDTLTLQPAYMMFTNRTGGANEKYSATMTDIRNKYFAEMVMGGSDKKVNELYQKFLSEMENRGHASEVLREQFQDYQDFLKTPAGKTATTLKMSNKFLDTSYLLYQPVEQNIPGVYYGDFSEWTVKMQ